MKQNNIDFPEETKKGSPFGLPLSSGTVEDRTPDLPHVKRTLIPAELRFHAQAIILTSTEKFKP